MGLASNQSRVDLNRKVSVGWVLRDMMQSTGVWTFEPEHLHRLVQHAIKVGFSSLEIGGGQSYQIALEHGVNPYQLIRNAKAVIDEAKAVLPLQVLLRGANQLGFQHYDLRIQQQNINLLVAAGGDTDKSKALIIRNFDALNDAENLRASIETIVAMDVAAAEANEISLLAGEKVTAKRVNVQAALSYVKPVDRDKQACYSVAYYVAYAKKLMAIAAQADGELDSLCIKDMSGQLTADNAIALIGGLKELGLPIYLHCHSTDEARAMAVQVVAVQQGIAGIEVAVEPLAGGASHNDVENLCQLDNLVALNRDEIAELKLTLSGLFGDRAKHRKDTAIPLSALKQLVNIGVPGGAIPFIIKDIQHNVCEMLGVDLDEALKMFEQELTRTQNLLGNVPLVTPTADIVAKQVIKSLGNVKRSAVYQLVDPRFCRLVLGHYGQVVNHATDAVVSVDSALIADIQNYCGAIDLDEGGLRQKAGKVYPDPMVLKEHPTLLCKAKDYSAVEDYVSDLFIRYPRSCEKFGSSQECFMMHVMRPAGKTDRLLTQNILGPTEQRLRYILDQTLHLLPGKDIPESREEDADETTDGLLLDQLSDYDGIVNTIKDLVLNGNSDSIRQRLAEKMEQVLSPIFTANTEAKANRYFFERRFVALFASAVFWDLQRVCRRTGSDSRANTDEMTARKLDRIISSTLRKRQREGRGPATRYLS